MGIAAAGARLVDAATGVHIGGTRLGAAIDAVAAALDRAPAGIVVCSLSNDLTSVLWYLGTLRTGRPALVWGPAGLDDLVGRFRPAAVFGAPPSLPGYALVDAPAAAGDAGPGAGGLWVRCSPPDAPQPHPDLAVLLGTSGSTGEPRLVRMSRTAVSAGTEAVRSSLRITGDDVAITTMPPYFAFGLSVLHSHLAAGATVVLEPRGVLDAGFWDDVDRYGVTSLAGVPHTYELLARKPWEPARNPGVRVLTAAGGRLRDELAARYHRLMADHGGALYVMYGQTEAGPRISVLPPEHLPAKLGSVGRPVPGMRLTITADPAADPTVDPAVDPAGDPTVDPAVDPTGGPGDGCDRDDPAGTGEVVCHGASVMMGYARTAADLARGDDLRGTLHTGDRGRLDPDGYLWLTGRLGRIGKAFGVRVNLDAVEHVVADLVVAAAVPAGDRIRVWCESADTQRLAAVRATVTSRLNLHRLGVSVQAVDRLPRRANGKVDYRALSRVSIGEL